MFALICCMSIFSSAKQSGNNCDKKSHCMPNKQNCTKQSRPESGARMGFDLSPLQLFVFGI